VAFKTRFLLYRFLAVFLIAALIKLVFFQHQHFFDFDLAYISFVVGIIWQGNLAIDRFLNQRFPWFPHPVKRIATQILGFTLFTATILFTCMYVIHQIKFGDGQVVNPKMKELFFPAFFLSLAFLAVIISLQFYVALKESLVQLERFKADSAQAQLQSLKSQINPHFLFNNLSVLTSLIHKDQDRAADFVVGMSKVYRYMLEIRHSELVPLQEELEYLTQYLLLLKVRFQDAVQFSVSVDAIDVKAFVVPLCLQTLVENAIQHNESSQEKCLRIGIYIENHRIVVENTRQDRATPTAGSGLGLENIRKRYHFYTDQSVDIVDNGRTFKVSMPLILQK